MKKIILTAGMLLVSSLLRASGMPTTITYQGTLKQGGLPATGSHNMSFKLTDVSGSAQYGSVVNLSNVPINQGLFSVQLDFTANGTTPVDWQSFIPYIQVNIDGQNLTPNEPLNATAYSLMSASVVDGSITAAKLAPGAVTTAALVPVGGMIDFPVATPPNANWHLADGAPVSRTTYSALFALIGNTFGNGDGVTTFNLPNYTNRTFMGAGDLYAVGSVGGSVNYSLAPHSHTVNEHTHSMSHYHDLPIYTTSEGGGSVLFIPIASASPFNYSPSNFHTTIDHPLGQGGPITAAQNLRSSQSSVANTGAASPGTDAQGGATIPTLSPYLAMFKMIRIL